MQNVYDLILRAAKGDTNVMLYGETGVGKDLVAKTIHDFSGFKGSYIPVNCGAIPEQLLESEFFGHVKGAFSGATSNRSGYLAAANNGTLFLDEIAELPVNLQVKLLRALESKTFTPVGSTEMRSSNFRLISATNRNIKTMLAQRQMRADFFYRIHVLPLMLPPLRERTGDIPLLCAAYAKTKGRPLPPCLLKTLIRHSWPGNIRELHNVLERYWAFDLLDLDTSPEQPEEKPYASLESLTAQKLEGTSTLSKIKQKFEQQQIISALDANDWGKGKTAKTLGITLRTLQRKIKLYGITK